MKAVGPRAARSREGTRTHSEERLVALRKKKRSFSVETEGFSCG